MRNLTCKWLALGVLTLGAMTTAVAVTPADAVEQGSYANEVLARATLAGIRGKVEGMGCATPQSYQPYVMKKPSGQPGSRTWQELWMVEGCGKQYPVLLNFREEGSGAASWHLAD